MVKLRDFASQTILCMLHAGPVLGETVLGLSGRSLAKSKKAFDSTSTSNFNDCKLVAFADMDIHARARRSDHSSFRNMRYATSKDATRTV